MHSTDTIRRLHEHRLWTREKILAVARTCSEAELGHAFEMGVGTLLGTMIHLWGAETVWANVLEQENNAFPLPGIEAFPTLASLESAWVPLDVRWVALLARASDPAFLASPMPRVREGKTYTTNAADIFLHVCTHQHYHAAQISNMLRQLGKSIGSSDLIVLAREQWGN